MCLEIVLKLGVDPRSLGKRLLAMTEVFAFACIWCTRLQKNAGNWYEGNILIVMMKVETVTVGDVCIWLIWFRRSGMTWRKDWSGAATVGWPGGRMIWCRLSGMTWRKDWSGAATVTWRKDDLVPPQWDDLEEGWSGAATVGWPGGRTDLVPPQWDDLEEGLIWCRHSGMTWRKDDLVLPQ